MASCLSRIFPYIQKEEERIDTVSIYLLLLCLGPGLVSLQMLELLCSVCGRRVEWRPQASGGCLGQFSCCYKCVKWKHRE